MSFCYRSNILYTGKPTGITDNIIVQTIIPLPDYSIPKGILKNAGAANTGTGNRRYWKMTVLENDGAGK